MSRTGSSGAGSTGVTPGAAPRLAYVCADRGITPDGVKGAAVHVREMVRALREAGAEVDVFLARGPRLPAQSSDAFPVHEVALPRHADGLAGEVRQLAAMSAFAEALAAHGPYDAVYERFALFGLGGAAFARQHGIPLLLEVNAPLWEEAARFRALHLAETARGAARDLLRAADRVLVVSEQLGAVVRAEGADPERVIHFPNGVRWETFASAAPARRPAALEGKPMLVFVGSLKPWHGVPFLLEAFAAAARRRSLGLWIVGDGPLREVVDAAARAHPGSIVAQGAVSHEDIPGILAAADVAVAPYTAESPAYFCPLKVVEALASGRPLLASDTPAVREVVGDPPVAALFAADDPVAFGRALEALLEDSVRREELTRRGRELVRAQLTWSRRAAEVLGMIAARRAGAGAAPADARVSPHAAVGVREANP